VTRRGGEDGDIITGWLLQLLMILALISLLVYEVVAVGVATVSVDDTTRDVARVARDTYRADRSLSTTIRASEAAAAEENTVVDALEVVEGELVLTLSKRARTLLIHRVTPMQDVATASSTRRVRWQP
jgi:hypothetical protein